MLGITLVAVPSNFCRRADYVPCLPEYGFEEFLEVAPALSLKTMGLLDKKSAPLLGVNGKLDDQAPIADVYLLMEHGNPKSARVYPEGHHMGRTPGQHPDEIANTIVGWLKEQFARG